MCKKFEACNKCEFKDNMSVVDEEIFSLSKSPEHTRDIIIVSDYLSEDNCIVEEALTGHNRILFKSLLKNAIHEDEYNLDNIGITNPIFCTPSGAIPKLETLARCKRLVVEFIKNLEPKLVIFLGKIPEQVLKKDFPNAITINHPSYHLDFGGQTSPQFDSDSKKIREALIEVGLIIDKEEEEEDI